MSANRVSSAPGSCMLTMAEINVNRWHRVTPYLNMLKIGLKP